MILFASHIYLLPADIPFSSPHIGSNFPHICRDFAGRASALRVSRSWCMCRLIIVRCICSSCAYTVPMVRSFSFSVTTCPKYCSTVSLTSFSDCRRCKRLTSTFTSASLLALTICPPNNIVDSGLMSIDFQGHCICISSVYLQQIVPLAENLWDIKMLFDANPICTLQPEEAKIFCQYYDLICTKTQYSSDRQKSIKEIACELDFSNLSFFGKYVKKHLGVSPKNYREQIIIRALPALDSVTGG